MLAFAHIGDEGRTPIRLFGQTGALFIAGHNGIICPAGIKAGTLSMREPHHDLSNGEPMAIQHRTDSDGNTFQVWEQRQKASCAIAAIWMAKCMATRTTIVEGEWELAWRTFNHAVMDGNWNASGMPAPQTFADSPRQGHNNQATMANMYGVYGTTLPQVAKSLRAQSLKVEIVGAPTMLNAPPVLRRLDPARLGDGRPAICFVHWFVGEIRVGGHFVVAARQAGNGKIVFLDPWKGELFELANSGRYQTAGRILQILYVTV